MNSIIPLLNDFSGPWAAWIWRATWQGAIVVAAAWLLTLLLRSRSPRFRSWIWRLAYLKLLVLLVWTTPLQLPLLPAEEGPVQGLATDRAVGSVLGGVPEAATMADSNEVRSIEDGAADNSFAMSSDRAKPTKASAAQKHSEEPE